MTRARRLPVVVVLAAAVAGCADDGRALRAPAPGATAPATASSTTAPPAFDPPGRSQDTPSSLELTSAAFAPGAAIPGRHACSGENLSPPLSWTGVPAGTVELAITVTDADADGFVHWVLGGLSPALTALGEGAAPEGAVQARNDTSEFGWFGPCPPAGASHRYVFTLYALGEPADLAIGVSGSEAIDRLVSRPGVSTTLTGTYITTDA